jgi:hypothetical protein
LLFPPTNCSAIKILIGRCVLPVLLRLKVLLVRFSRQLLLALSLPLMTKGFLFLVVGSGLVVLTAARHRSLTRFGH